MTKSAQRVTHRGAHGLFDDIDEGSHSEAHELHHVQKTSRRHQTNKEARMAERIARGKPAESKLSCLFAKVLPRSDRKDGFERFDDEKEDPSQGITITVNGNAMPGESPMYQNRVWDIGAVESPWLKECGMIRVKSNSPGGCHIVAKPFILRD